MGTQIGAISFLQGHDRDVNDKLGIEIFAGDHPGSSYFAAELRSDIEGASRNSEVLGLQFCFRLTHVQGDTAEGRDTGTLCFHYRDACPRCWKANKPDDIARMRLRPKAAGNIWATTTRGGRAPLK